MTEALATALTAITTIAISYLRPKVGAEPNSDQEFAVTRIPVPNCDVTSLSEAQPGSLVTVPPTGGRAVTGIIGVLPTHAQHANSPREDPWLR